MARRLLSPVLVVVLLVSACQTGSESGSTATSPTASSATAQTTVEPTAAPSPAVEPTAVAPTVESTSAPSPTAVPTPSPTEIPVALEIPIAAGPSPLEQDLFSYPYPTELATSDFALLVDQADGAPVLAMMGHRHVQVLRHDQTPVDTQPAASYGDYALPTSIVALNGEFLLAIGGYESDATLLPALLRWNQADEAWRPIDATVTRPAMSRTVGRSRATPPSPPFEGAVAIMDMVEHDGRIWATGWATIDDVLSAALWTSSDGINWTLEPIPAAREEFGPEYGLSLSVTSLGVMVGLGNGTHYGAGIVVRTQRSEWSTLPFPTTDDATSLARVVKSVDGQAWIIEQFFDGPDMMFSSDDLETWTIIELPPVEDVVGDDGFPAGGFWNLDPDHSAGPVGWYSDYDWGADPPASTAWQWDADNEHFVTTQVPGFYVGTQHGFVVTQQSGSFLVIPVRR